MPGKTGKRRRIKSDQKGERRKRNRDTRNSPAETEKIRPDDSPAVELGMSILQKYLEPDTNREKEIAERKREIMAAKQAKEERRRKAMKEAAASRVSYVRKPFAVRSRMSMTLGTAALALGGVGLYEGVTTQGQAPLACGAMGLCSILLSVLAVWYGAISFWEDDKNYILAKLGIALGLLLLAAWAVIIRIGLGG